jgi:hypothetical protein
VELLPAVGLGKDDLGRPSRGSCDPQLVRETPAAGPAQEVGDAASAHALRGVERATNLRTVVTDGTRFSQSIADGGVRVAWPGRGPLFRTVAAEC